MAPCTTRSRAAVEDTAIRASATAGSCGRRCVTVSSPSRPRAKPTGWKTADRPIMAFCLSEQQRAVRDLFARFCDERIVPVAAALDASHAFPRELFGQLAQLGFFGMRYPEGVGGTGMNLLSFCLALAEISRGSVALAGCAAMQSLMGTDFVHRLGNADLLERLFKPALKGEKIGASFLDP